MKKWIILTLVASLGAQAAQASYVYVEDYLEVSSTKNRFVGTVKAYKDKFVDIRYSGKDTATFKVLKNEKNFNSAEKIAKYLWRNFFEYVRTKAPFPCGEYSMGEITLSGKQLRTSTTEFTIEGSGDGWADTCLGHGGPGWWQVSLKVKYNNETKTGTFIYSFDAE